MVKPNRIQVLREARGISQAELARLLGAAEPEISRLSSGKRPLTEAWLHRIADALMVQRDEIYEERPAPVNHVRQLREAAGISQEELAAKLYWPTAKVRALEAATRLPTDDMVRQVAEALGCGLFDLIDEPMVVQPEEKAVIERLRGMSEPERSVFKSFLDTFGRRPE